MGLSAQGARPTSPSSLLSIPSFSPNLELGSICTWSQWCTFTDSECLPHPGGGGKSTESFPDLLYDR